MISIGDITASFELATRVPEVGALLLSLAKRLRGRPKDQAPGDKPTRIAAYRRFQDAAITASLNLQALARVGLPPKLGGAVWTWPSAMRASNRSIESLNETSCALYEIALVGDDTVLDAATTTAEALGQMASSFPARRGGGALPDDFAELAERASSRLFDFVAAGRGDLQRKE